MSSERREGEVDEKEAEGQDEVKEENVQEAPHEEEEGAGDS